MADDINTPSEEWRAIPGHDGYEVSNLGRVRVLDRVVLYRQKSGTLVTRKMKGQDLSVSCSGPHRQYRCVALGGKNKQYVHRLVALAFLGDPPTPKHEVAHWNGLGSDNRLTNIRWATRKENNLDKRRHGTMGTPKGQDHCHAKLTNEAVSHIRSSYTGKHGEKAKFARMYGVGGFAIRNVLKRKTWKHIS